MENIFKIIDKYICKYIGIKGNEPDLPVFVKKRNGSIFVESKERFKRYLYVTDINKFGRSQSWQLSQSDKINLGISAGSLIAKNLVILVDDTDK